MATGDALFVLHALLCVLRLFVSASAGKFYVNFVLCIALIVAPLAPHDLVDMVVMWAPALEFVRVVMAGGDGYEMLFCLARICGPVLLRAKHTDYGLKSSPSLMTVGAVVGAVILSRCLEINALDVEFLLDIASTGLYVGYACRVLSAQHAVSPSEQSDVFAPVAAADEPDELAIRQPPTSSPITSPERSPDLPAPPVYAANSRVLGADGTAGGELWEIPVIALPGSTDTSNEDAVECRAILVEFVAEMQCFSGLVLTDAEGIILAGNTAFLSLGAASGESTGQLLVDLLDDNDVESVRECLRSSQSSEEVLRVTFKTGLVAELLHTALTDQHVWCIRTTRRKSSKTTSDSPTGLSGSNSEDTGKRRLRRQSMPPVSRSPDPDIWMPQGADLELNGGIKVLYVDDDVAESHVSTIARCLDTHFSKGVGKNKLDVARNGVEALALFQQAFSDGKPYHIILLDMLMPIMTGYTAVGLIREWESIQGVRTVPVLALTGANLPMDGPKCVAAGCTGYTSKPYEPNELMAEIHNMLESAVDSQSTLETSDSTNMDSERQRGLLLHKLKVETIKLRHAVRVNNEKHIKEGVEAIEEIGIHLDDDHISTFTANVVPTRIGTQLTNIVTNLCAYSNAICSDFMADRFGMTKRQSSRDSDDTLKLEARRRARSFDVSQEVRDIALQSQHAFSAGDLQGVADAGMQLIGIGQSSNNEKLMSAGRTLHNATRLDAVVESTIFELANSDDDGEREVFSLTLDDI